MSWEAAEELLRVCAKPRVPRGSDWMPGTFLRCWLTWPREAEPGQEERGMSRSQVVVTSRFCGVDVLDKPKDIRDDLSLLMMALEMLASSWR